MFDLYVLREYHRPRIFLWTYHKKSWARNVTSVLWKGAGNNSNSACLGSAEIVTEVEF